MTVKELDRRRAFWVSFLYIVLAPLMVYLGANIEAIQMSVMALTGLGVANYATKPSEEG